ncbi:hypothetical protein K505DRAFT_303040 [Melanomma pulvis-pyrius CBS 109.77]|uniref:Uncharacterized protein n=1 Tax=Melanomma pulvis-pyrius CBS 109.77 TaxID=1314802 RepID=A0A6A6XGD3_9PLEO|nr:hypothetical protein K505DRAFT_303040 [Melanomma pulvis-pyrius CBS 109.77]
MELDLGIPPEPKEFGVLFDSTSNIIIFSGSDPHFHLRHRLGLEFDDTPLRNPELARDTDGQRDLTQNITLIYITRFFTDRVDFALYIKGIKNMTEFSKGTFSKKAYVGPCFATPVMGYECEDLFNDAKLITTRLDTVSRTETKGLRWRYYYETARRAWDMLEFDWEKFRERQRMEEREMEEMDIGERASPPTSQSETPPEDYALTPSDDETEETETYGKEEEEEEEEEEEKKDTGVDLRGEGEALELEKRDSETA